MKFEEVKETIVSRAFKLGACEGELERAKKSTNKQELLKVIKKNFVWCYREKKLLDIIDFHTFFGEELCAEFGLYYRGEIEELKDKKDIILFGDVHVNRLVSCNVDYMFDTSKIGILVSSRVFQMTDLSSIREMRDESCVEFMYGSSRVSLMLDVSKIGEMTNHSIVGCMMDESTINHMWNRSRVYSLNESSTVKHMYDYSQITTYNNLPETIHDDVCIVIDKKRNKILTKKDYQIETMKPQISRDINIWDNYDFTTIKPTINELLMGQSKFLEEMTSGRVVAEICSVDNVKHILYIVAPSLGNFRQKILTVIGNSESGHFPVSITTPHVYGAVISGIDGVERDDFLDKIESIIQTPSVRNKIESLNQSVIKHEQTQ